MSMRAPSFSLQHVPDFPLFQSQSQHFSRNRIKHHLLCFSFHIRTPKHNKAIRKGFFLRNFNVSYPVFTWLYVFDTVILKILPPSLMRCLLDSASSLAASAAFTISINAFSTCKENMIKLLNFYIYHADKSYNHIL